MSRKSRHKHRPTQPSHAHPDSHAQPEQDRIAGIVSCTLSPELSSKWEINQNEQSKRENRRFKVEIASLGALVVYTLLTFSLVVLSVCTMRNAHEQFRVDQRPYVWLAKDLGPFSLVAEGNGPASGKLAFYIPIANYGKSPAVRCQMEAKIAIGKDGWKKITWARLDDKKGSILPPGKIDFNSAYSNDSVAPEMLTKIATPGLMEPVEVLGHIQYFGTDGTPYTSDFCVGRSPTLTLYNCDYHNEIK